MNRDLNKRHFSTPLHHELQVQCRGEITLDWKQEYLLLPQLCNYMVMTISKSFQLYRSWLPCCKRGCLNQMNFSFRILWSDSHTFSRPPVARAQAITVHITLSLAGSICSGWTIFELTHSFSSALLFSAYGVLGSPFHLPLLVLPADSTQVSPTMRSSLQSQSSLTVLSFWIDAPKCVFLILPGLNWETHGGQSSKSDTISLSPNIRLHIQNLPFLFCQRNSTITYLLKLLGRINEV